MVIKKILQHGLILGLKRLDVTSFGTILLKKMEKSRNSL
jgi:hypothetical protein